MSKKLVCKHEVKSTDCICSKCGICLHTPGCTCASGISAETLLCDLKEMYAMGCGYRTCRVSSGNVSHGECAMHFGLYQLIESLKNSDKVRT